MATLHTSPLAGMLRRALCVSALVHGGVAGVLIADFLSPFLLAARSIPYPNHVVLQARTGPPSIETGEPLADAVMETKASSTLSAAEIGRTVEEVFGNRTANAVQQAAGEAQQKSPQANRDELEQLAGKLGRISSEKSVDEMTGKLRKWLGAGARAERPANKTIAGEFDFSTAQLHDVRREANADAGDWAYFAILVDAAGRRYESPMDALEGESAYKTMQLVKANPLAEMVYRRVVMGFLDNVIKAGKAARDASEAAEAAKPQAEAAPD